MTSRQECKLSMYLVVKELLTTYATIVNALPNFAGFLTALQSAITQIQTYGEQQMFDKKGLKVSKTQLKNTLVMLSADASRKLQAYAKFTNNQLLLSETKFTESDLKLAADTSLRDNAQGIYNRAQTNLAALAAYGLTAATQTTLLNAINAFVASIPKPRLGTADKKLSTLQVKNGFVAADGALENIDMLVDILKLSQPNFYSNYKTARKIIETGTSTLSIKGQVIDAITGEPIKGVKVTFSLDTTTTKSKATSIVETVVKKTAEKGGFIIKSIPEGMYQVTLSKNGYTEQVETLAVSDGELSVLNIKLSRN